jgi:SAM-dependent methyltransferase
MGNQKISDKPCSLCSNTQYHYRFKKNGFKIVSCTKCGLVKTVIPDELLLNSIYNETYFQGGQTDGYADYIASEKVLKHEFGRIIEKLLLFQDKRDRKKLLEIGCAYGFFLELANEHFDCVGIEVSETAAAFASKRNKNIFCGEVNDEIIGSVGRIDVVVMLDVIEHLPYPGEIIKSLSQKLSTGGLILLTTGDIGSYYAKLSGKYWRLMTPPQHVTFFSVSTLKDILEKYGFKIIAINRPYKIVPIGLAMFQIGRLIKLKLPRKLTTLLSQIYIPINLFDAVQVIAIKK